MYESLDKKSFDKDNIFVAAGTLAFWTVSFVLVMRNEPDLFVFKQNYPKENFAGFLFKLTNIIFFVGFFALLVYHVFVRKWILKVHLYLNLFIGCFLLNNFLEHSHLAYKFWLSAGLYLFIFATLFRVFDCMTFGNFPYPIGFFIDRSCISRNFSGWCS